MVTEASRWLGVSPTTLRQWTDEGRVKAFVTPGGHRRYSPESLQTFQRTHPRAQGPADLAAQIEQGIQHHREIAQEFFQAHPPCGLPQGYEQRFRERGRQMVGLIVQAITHPSRREEAVQAATALGRDYAQDIALLGLSLPQALEAFLQHRAAVLEATIRVLGRRQPIHKRALDLIPQISRLLDRSLLAVAEAFQGAQTSP